MTPKLVMSLVVMLLMLLLVMLVLLLLMLVLVVAKMRRVVLMDSGPCVHCDPPSEMNKVYSNGLTSCSSNHNCKSAKLISTFRHSTLPERPQSRFSRRWNAFRQGKAQLRSKLGYSC